MKLGVVGATGLVGQKFLQLLEKEKSFQIEELKLFSRSPKFCSFLNKKIETQPLAKNTFEGLDICFFSAGQDVSLEWAPQAVKQGAIVIDNSSAFRFDPDKLLIVPEVNSHLLNYKAQIISNPNCSTIQLVVALQALEKAFGLESVHVVSLQSISGAGAGALKHLKEESLSILKEEKSYKQHEIDYAFNCVPFIGSLNAEGFCSEEVKIMTESKKILELPQLKISAFTVRVPCLNSHSEAVRFSIKKQANKDELLSALSSYVDTSELFPHARGADQEKQIFVGRVHKDPSLENSWWMWLVADNLLKGASWNGLQIAQELVKIKK
ncbi:MAG: aspartate-semialdehyde dehydrogenase [Bdellovibrionaceae bacterium]|nr:aspartate-semialdehyde dehydrogenase [Pseudobdellovibrionaceae bacterium]